MASTATMGGDGALFVGEDKKFRLTLLDLNGVPVDMTGWAIMFVVRLNDATVDPPIFSKSAALEGVYDADPLVNTQDAYVQLTATEMRTVKARTYRQSWKRMTAVSETVLERGPFVVEVATNY